MITEALLAGILGSQWAIARKMGVAAEDIKQSMTSGMARQLIAQGMIPYEIPEGLRPFSRVELDLSSARTMEELSMAGQWLTVESCTGSDVACTIDQRGDAGSPDPLYLDRVTSINYPFKRLYLSHSAQPGAVCKLLIGRAALRIDKESPTLAAINTTLGSILTALSGLETETLSPSLLRWGIDMSDIAKWPLGPDPVWAYGLPQMGGAITPGDAYVGVEVPPGQTIAVFGISVGAGEAASFGLMPFSAGGDTTMALYQIGGAGTIMIVSPVALIRWTNVTGNTVPVGLFAASVPPGPMTMFQANMLYNLGVLA